MNINNRGVHVSNVPSSKSDSSAIEPMAVISVSMGSVSRSPALSTLSRQLAESSARAEFREANFSFRELGDEVRRLGSQIFGDTYQANKAEHNEALPDTTDVELLERAKQATDYVVRSDQHDRTARNPFSGLSRTQLDLIVYDEGDSFTVNERRAAHYAVSDIEQAWRQRLIIDREFELATGDGRTPKFYAAILDHYRALPATEKAMLPEDYETQLKDLVEGDGGVNDGITTYTLFERLARFLNHSDSKVESEVPGRAVGEDQTAATSLSFLGRVDDGLDQLNS